MLCKTMQQKEKSGTNAQPLVSIGVPAYNGGKYLKECLDSVLKQTYGNWECVVCNNASTDDTAAIAQSYADGDQRFRLFHTDRLLPITENWNYCFSNISEGAKYFKLLPADDWIFPEFLTRMVEVMESEPGAGICSSFRLVDTILRSEGLDVYQGNRFPGKEILVRELRRELNITSSINAVLYRMETLRSLPYFPEIFRDEAFHQDTFLSYELLNRSDLGFVHQVLSYTRRHGESVTSTVTSKLNTRLYFMEYALHHFIRLDPALKEEYRKTRLRYAYFWFKTILFRRKTVLAWHRTRLTRTIKLVEYLQAIAARLLGRKL